MLFSENINLFNHSARTLLTDRQMHTDRDRQTGLLCQYRAMHIVHRAVKTLVASTFQNPYLFAVI